MASLPHESPQEDIRNALAIIVNLHTVTPSLEGGLSYELTIADRRAIVDRLYSAITKLEAHPRTLTMHGLASDCPTVKAGNATRCPGHWA